MWFIGLCLFYNSQNSLFNKGLKQGLFILLNQISTLPQSDDNLTAYGRQKLKL